MVRDGARFLEHNLDRLMELGRFFRDFRMYFESMKTNLGEQAFGRKVARLQDRRILKAMFPDSVRRLLDPKPGECPECGEKGTLACCKCHSVVYCGKEHRDSHYSFHKHACHVCRCSMHRGENKIQIEDARKFNQEP